MTSDTETHEQESDYEYGHLGNGSLEESYTEEPTETTEEVSLHDYEEAIHSQTDQVHVEEPEELVRPHSPEFLDHTEGDVLPRAASSEEREQEQAKDDIADIVGLLESTSFSSKHILQGSDEGVTPDSRTPGSDTERRGIGEIPDEE